jgi:hypothetical protein
LLAVGLVIAAALAVPGSAAAASSSSEEFFGVNVNKVLRNGREIQSSDPHVAAIAEHGLRLGRSDAFWGWAEPFAPVGGRHGYQWGRLDTTVNSLAEQGIRWLPIIDYSTYWDSSLGGTDKAPPRTNDNYAEFARQLVLRYGPGGAFWRGRPWLTPLPVTAYEVWNEPNLSFFWLTGPDPARYADLYMATRAAIRSVDRSAKVLVGGLANSDADGYLEGMYEAEPDLKYDVDGVAFHPYAVSADHVLKSIRGVREQMNELDRDEVPLYVTEVGWPTQGEGSLSADAIPDRARAASLSLLSDSLGNSDCGIGAFTPYTWVTPQRDPGLDEDWLGIYNSDVTSTESSVAYEAAVDRRGGDDFDGYEDEPLGICLGESDGKPLKLTLSLNRRRDGSDTCYDAVVTYRGRRINGVLVDFDYTASRDGRVKSSRGKRVRTDAEGEAPYCMEIPSDGYDRELTAAAEVKDAAEARDASVEMR